MEVQIFAIDLPLAHTFKISKDARTSQPSLAISLTKEGVTGLGACTATKYYGLHIEEMYKTLKSALSDILMIPTTSAAEWYPLLMEILPHEPFLRAAIDMALHDWVGKKIGQPLRVLWGMEGTVEHPTAYTIGIDDWDVMAQKIIEKPWPIYKIKLGTSDDLGLIRHLRKHTKAPFWVDANEAWSVDVCLDLAKALANEQVVMIEQPVHRTMDSALAQIKLKSPIPFIADESCQGVEDIQKCKNVYHGVNVKVMKCGGLTPAIEMIQQARAQGLKVMVGCMTESIIGISALAHLMTVIDYADLDGAMLLKTDIATGVDFLNGFPIFPQVHGAGATLEAYAKWKHIEIRM